MNIQVGEITGIEVSDIVCFELNIVRSSCCSVGTNIKYGQSLPNVFAIVCLICQMLDLDSYVKG